MVEDDRLPGGNPSQAAVRNAARWIVDVLRKREKAIVRPNQVDGVRNIFVGGAARDRVELRLAVPWIAVEIGAAAGAAIAVAQPAGAGDVEKQICALAESLGLQLRCAVVYPIGAADRPATAQLDAGIGEGIGEIAHVPHDVVGERLRPGVVEPVPGVLEVEHLVTETREAGDVGDVVPRDTAQGIRGDESGNDDAHRRGISPWRYGDRKQFEFRGLSQCLRCARTSLAVPVTETTRDPTVRDRIVPTATRVILDPICVAPLPGGI